MRPTASPLAGLDAAIAAAGGKAALARALNKSKSAISNWRRRDGAVPVSAVPHVTKATGVPPHELRPDLFDAPQPVEVA